MTENENEETIDETNDEFVTHSQLEALLDEKLSSLVDRLTGDTLPETETTDDVDEIVGTFSPSELEAMLEKKVADAMKRLTEKKASRPVTKKATPKPPPAKEKPTADDEAKPSLPGKKSLSERLWGNGK